MAFLSDLANGLIKSVTGQDPSALAAQAEAAQQQLTLAFETMIILQAVMAAELLIIAALIFKEK
jgi:hypothetical protein